VHTEPPCEISLIPSTFSLDLGPASLVATNNSYIEIVGSGALQLSNDMVLNNVIVTSSIPQSIVSTQLLMQEHNTSILQN
jgi:hypothetical protein